MGLYVHIPFCAEKCGYCDFYSVKSGEKIHELYVDALVKQMKECSLPVKENMIDTVFIGGGTPTCIDIDLLLKVIKNIKSFFGLSKTVEFTVEANPKTVDLKELKKLYKAGVNRLSIGLQSADDKELRMLSRIHNYADFEECYENARTAGFKNISVDVMYGIPGQNSKSFYETLKKVTRLKPEHLSAYGLKIEPNTLFYKNYEKIQKYLPPEDDERNMYFICREFLERGGYNQYEISNFAKSGYECRHNLKYWNCEEYIGLGTGAHSYFSNCRFSFKKDIKEYIKNFNYDENKLQKFDVFDHEKYSLFDEYAEIKPGERIGEYIMLGLRLKSGIDKNKFAKLFRADFDVLYYNKIAPFIESGHIVQTNEGYAFSPDGMFVSNYILSRIIDFE